MQPYAKKVALGSAIALSAGGGYLALNQRRPILMEAALRRDKLPIYPASQPEIVLVETSSELESHIAAARESTTTVVRSAREATQRVVSRWINVERRVAAHVNRIVPDDEPLTPGIAWVGVSTLAGSLVSRNRTFLLRLVAPPAFLLLALPYFLPKLSSNLSRELSSATLARAPELHAQASAAGHALDDVLERAEDWADDARETVGDAVGKTVSLVERSTGLQLYKAFESSFARSPTAAHHGRHDDGADEQVTISAQPVGSRVVPLFEQAPTTPASTVPGTPLSAPATTTAPVAVQTVHVPVFRQLDGKASTTTATEKLDAAAAHGLAKVEDKVGQGVAAVRQSEAAHAVEAKAGEAKAGLADLKHQAERALAAAPSRAAAAVDQAKQGVVTGERKAERAVVAGERKADEVVSQAQAGLASAAGKTRAEAANVEAHAADAAQAVKGQAKAAARAVEGEAGALAHDAQAAAAAAQAKAAGAAQAVKAEAAHVRSEAGSLAADAKNQAGALAQAAQDKAAAVASQAKAALHAGEDKARSALASAESKANAAVGAVKGEASDVKAALAKADADKRLKVDEQTVDGKRPGQPAVVGLLAGRERESGYKKLV